MRHMSFSLTTPQFLDGTKSVTRRLGWNNLRPGALVMAVEKAQGLRRGEKVRKLGVIRIVSVRRERLHQITQRDVVREGFSDWTCAEFIEMFCRANRCDRLAEVNRIEFEHVEEGTP
jgi:hypothetical protein